jgi:uncharacterized protein YecT (DUF1311 family)
MRLRGAAGAAFWAALFVGACKPTQTLAPSTIQPVAAASSASSAAPLGPTGRASSAPSSSAAPEAPAPDPEAECARVASAAFPRADRPPPGELPTLRGCDAEALYYGIGRPPDFAAARRCAYAQMETKQPPVFGGESILMMIYANGRDVATNLDLATKLACTASWAEAERDGRVRHLAALRRRPGSTGFDLCDDITSGYMMGACTAHSERVRSLARGARKQEATKGLPALELGRLEQAAAAFFDARERNEVDLSGTARAALQIEERSKLERDYVESLAKIRTRDLPPPSDFASADVELNRVYAKIMSTKIDPDSLYGIYGSVQPKGVQETQRVWLRFRDAWAELGVKVRPEIKSEAWKAWVTRERTKMLQDLMPSSD